MLHRIPRVLRKSRRFASQRFHLARTLRAPSYRNPTPMEFDQIEQALRYQGVELIDYAPEPGRFAAFRTTVAFPADYHGGPQGGVYDEKLLEHFIAFDLLNITDYAPGEAYLDIAACSSPWAQLLRERLGVEAFAIDLAVPADYQHLAYYQQGDATQTRFAPASLRGASLQCAYEMFTGEDDVALIFELARTLKSGGKCIIAPLYMHTHHCGYSTAEYFDRGHADPGAVQYVQRNYWGIPFSRKYDALKLKTRILDEIERQGMHYRLLVLRNQRSLGQDIYCHFILEVTR